MHTYKIYVNGYRDACMCVYIVVVHRTLIYLAYLYSLIHLSIESVLGIGNYLLITSVRCIMSKSVVLYLTGLLKQAQQGQCVHSKEPVQPVIYTRL